MQLGSRCGVWGSTAPSIVTATGFLFVRPMTAQLMSAAACGSEGRQAVSLIVDDWRGLARSDNLGSRRFSGGYCRWCSGRICGCSISGGGGGSLCLGFEGNFGARAHPGARRYQRSGHLVDGGALGVSLHYVARQPHLSSGAVQGLDNRNCLRFVWQEYRSHSHFLSCIEVIASVDVTIFREYIRDQLLTSTTPSRAQLRCSRVGPG